MARATGQKVAQLWHDPHIGPHGDGDPRLFRAADLVDAPIDEVDVVVCEDPAVSRQEQSRAEGVVQMDHIYGVHHIVPQLLDEGRQIAM